MPNTVSLNLQLAVRDGQLNAARDLMNEMVASSKQESGAESYEWYISDDGTTCHVNERYSDSDAALVHLGNFGANFAERFPGCFQPTALSVYGDPSPEAKAALDGFGAAYYGWLGGFNR
jgi:quinol monooxygenase YgiN